jgi:hypothetical protein
MVDTEKLTLTAAGHHDRCAMDMLYPPSIAPDRS